MSAIYLMLTAAVCVALVAAQATPAISAPPLSAGEPMGNGMVPFGVCERACSHQVQQNSIAMQNGCMDYHSKTFTDNLVWIKEQMNATGKTCESCLAAVQRLQSVDEANRECKNAALVASNVCTNNIAKATINATESASTAASALIDAVRDCDFTELHGVCFSLMGAFMGVIGVYFFCKDHHWRVALHVALCLAAQYGLMYHLIAVESASLKVNPKYSSFAITIGNWRFNGRITFAFIGLAASGASALFALRFSAGHAGTAGETVASLNAQIGKLQGEVKDLTRENKGHVNANSARQKAFQAVAAAEARKKQCVPPAV